MHKITNQVSLYRNVQSTWDKCKPGAEWNVYWKTVLNVTTSDRSGWKAKLRQVEIQQSLFDTRHNQQSEEVTHETELNTWQENKTIQILRTRILKHIQNFD